MSNESKPRQEDPVARANFRQLEKRIQADASAYSNHRVELSRGFPERDFVITFLPYFCGEITEGLETAITTWIKIAGSAMAEVSLLNDAGKVVATVPSIANPQVFDPGKEKRGRGMEMARILMAARNQSTVNPRAASAMLVGDTIEKIDSTISQKAIVEHYQRWEELLSRYGKSLRLAVQTNTPTQQASDDSYDYE